MAKWMGEYSPATGWVLSLVAERGFRRIVWRSAANPEHSGGGCASTGIAYPMVEYYVGGGALADALAKLLQDELLRHLPPDGWVLPERLLVRWLLLRRGREEFL